MMGNFDSTWILAMGLQRASDVTRIRVPQETSQILLDWSERNVRAIERDLADNLIDSEDLIDAVYLQVLDAAVTQRHLARRGPSAELDVDTVGNLSYFMSAREVLVEFGKIQDYVRNNEISRLSMAVSMVRSCRYPPFGRVRC